MKKYIPAIISAFIVVGIFVFFYVMSKLQLTLSLTPFDPITMPIINSLSAWVAGSVFTLSLFYNFFQWLKTKAILSDNNTDNAILTYLINFFSLQWFKGLTSQDGQNKNPDVKG